MQTSSMPTLLRQTCSLVLVGFSLSASFCLSQAFAADLAWPDRSGPEGNGHAAERDAKGVPFEWNEADGTNIAWKIALEGEGHSSPIIGQGVIWLTSATKNGKKQYLYAIDERSGKVLHHKLLFENEAPEPLANAVNSYASPSCVLTEDALFVHFGTYGTARIDPSTAEIVWQRRDIKCRHFRGPGSSPVLFENLLILTFDGIDQQFLMALNIETGETVWRTDRSTNYGDLDQNGKPRGDGDLRKAYGTPLVVQVGDRWQVVSVGSRAGFGYDARTGKEIWTFTHDDYNAAAKPLTFGNSTIINTGSNGANLLAIRLDESTQGNIDKTHVLWNRPRGNAHLANPLLVGDRVYQVTDSGVCVCVDAKTGEEIWTARIGGKFVASPIAVNGLIYVCNEAGVATVLRDGDEYVVVAQNEIKEGMRATPAVSQGALFLRTFGHLYKISNRAKAAE
ncbi:MAG: PQQ-binding-like beta-propeller repeat protein [Planctomycetaceae bacterium]